MKTKSLNPKTSCLSQKSNPSQFRQMGSIMSEEREIPKGWVETSLGVICVKAAIIQRKTVNPNEDLLYLDIGAIDNISNKIISHKNYKWKDAPSRAQQVVYHNDILFSTVRTYLKNIAQIETKLYDGQIASSGFTVIRGNQIAVNPKFLFYLTISHSFLQPLNELQTGTSYPAVRDNDVLFQSILLPPLPEQHRIVAKIEELFSSLDKGIESLKTAQEQLKIYRQAVLKWAFEGKLSKSLNYDSSDSHDNHESKVKKYHGNQINHKNQGSDNELPEGWKNKKLSEVCGMKAGFFIKASEIQENFEEGLFPCYGGNGLRGYVNSSTHNGMFPLVGRQGALCGNVHLVSGKFHATEHAVVVTANDDMNVKWLYYKLVSMRLNQYSSGVAQPGLSVNKLLPIELLVPVLSEQHRIVSEIESRLSVCDKIEESISTSLQQAEALRQSILKKAFEGKLVEQDPNDEPASVLLRRITAAKINTQKMPKASNLYSKNKTTHNPTPKGSNNKAFEGKLVAQNPNDEPASVLLERITAVKINTQKMPKASKLYSKNKATHNPTPKESNNKAFEGKLVAQDPNDEPASVPLERITAAKINTQKMPKASKLYSKNKATHNPTPKESNKNRK